MATAIFVNCGTRSGVFVREKTPFSSLWNPSRGLTIVTGGPAIVDWVLVPAALAFEVCREVGSPVNMLYSDWFLGQCGAHRLGSSPFVTQPAEAA
jgi:hypothetical protein